MLFLKDQKSGYLNLHFLTKRLFYRSKQVFIVMNFQLWYSDCYLICFDKIELRMSSFSSDLCIKRWFITLLDIHGRLTRQFKGKQTQWHLVEQCISKHYIFIVLYLSIECKIMSFFWYLCSLVPLFVRLNKVDIFICSCSTYNCWHNGVNKMFTPSVRISLIYRSFCILSS